MRQRGKTRDAKITVKGKFKPSSAAEKEFFRALKKVAQASSQIINAHVDGVKILEPLEMKRTLEAYSKLIGPWAARQSAKLLDQVQKSNKKAYRAKSNLLAEGMQLMGNESQEGLLAASLMQEQVALIKSIPIEAGLRAQKIAYEAVLSGTRAEANKDTVSELQKQLGLTEEVAISRAKLISITETARANAAINQSRAMSVGSKQYRWRNSGDGAVRESHKRRKGKQLDGQIFSWDEPPTLDDGTKGHPGTFPRCRCYAEPVFDTE